MSSKAHLRFVIAEIVVMVAAMLVLHFRQQQQLTMIHTIQSEIHATSR